MRPDLPVEEVRARSVRASCLIAHALLLAGLSLTACSEAWYREWADDEVASIVESKVEELADLELLAVRDYYVEQRPLMLADLGKVAEAEEYLQSPEPKPRLPTDPEAQREVDPDAAYSDLEAIDGTPRSSTRVLSLAECVRLALANNRQYQSQRESVYLSALALSLVRWEFTPRFFGMVTGSYDRGADGERSGRIDTSLGLNWTSLWTNGTRISLTALNNLFQFFSGSRREVASTILEGTLTQPLLRGFRGEVVQEPLVQAERDVVYAIRSFERDRKELAVQVISGYYRTLESRVRVVNEYLNWQSLADSALRVQNLVEAGSVEPLQIDQARQQELQAKDRFFGAAQSYETQRDDFKITLGIPVFESIILDLAELDQLRERGATEIDAELASAIDVALSERLDLLNQRDQLEDAERRVRVTADALRTQFDVNASFEVPSGQENGEKPFKFNFDDLSYGFGFSLDLPFDRKAERNRYVRSIITHVQGIRDLSLFEDNIRLTVRDNFRALEREVISYAIQRQSLLLAITRVDSTSSLLEAGRAETRDVLESQEALIDARNALIGSLINYTLARLEFFRDTGRLRVEDDGSVTELAIESTPENEAIN